MLLFLLALFLIPSHWIPIDILDALFSSVALEVFTFCGVGIVAGLAYISFKFRSTSGFWVYF